jgi:hypothetical protein
MAEKPDETVGIAESLGMGRGGQEIEATRPEPRSAVPELVRGGVFPVKARIVKLQSFENDPNDGIGDLTRGLPWSGKLTSTVDVTTGAVTAIGLAQQVNDWLLMAEEKEMLDWELSQDAITGYPRFLILYTE